MKELFQMINDKNFLAVDDNKLNDSMIDIVELPPDTVDGLLDHEELDDNNMDNEVPPGVKRHAEIHHAAGKEESNELDHADPTKSQATSLLKHHRLKKESCP